MAPHLPDLKRTFSTLTELTKGFSKDGTEMFYTISFDAWLRKDPADLVAFLEKKRPEPEKPEITDIGYRIKLQLEAYKHKIITNKIEKKKPKKKVEKEGVRGLNIYVLSNGEWRGGAGLKAALREMTGFLKSEGLEGHLVINFVSFAQSPKAVQRFVDLASGDYGL